MHTKSNALRSSFSSPWAFFGLALGWSWLFWITAIVLGISFETPLGIILGMLGLFGPMVAGLTSIRLNYGKEGRRDYWRRIVDTRRIGSRWYVIILLLVPVIFALSVALDILL